MTTPNFQKLFEGTPGLLIVLSPDFTIVAANDAYLQAAKAVREKVIGTPYFETFPDSDDDAGKIRAQKLRESLDKVLKTKQTDVMNPRKFDTSKTGVVDEGIKYWGSVNAPILGTDGEVLYLIRRIDDLTPIVRQQKERKAIEQERDVFFAYSYDLLGVVGVDGYFKRVNPAFEKTLGYTEDELLAQPISFFLHPEDVARTKERIRTLTAGTPTIASINRYRCKDGNYKWFSWNTTPMGKLLYSVGRDITEQKKVEDRIQQLNSELGRKNEDLEFKIKDRVTELNRSEAQVQQLQKMDAVGRLAGGIAHDFNNMLAIMTMYCDIILDDGDDTRGIPAKVDDLRGVIDRASALTRQLLVFSRKQMVQPQRIDLNPLILQLEKMLARLIGENIKIVTRLAGDLKTVNVDPSQMEQVVLNLVVNAKDAMPKGGLITIETNNVYLDETFTSTHLSVKAGHYALLSVSDNGCGMDAQTVAKIFEPFFTTKAVGKGTGLGLTTTYGIIKQASGTIWVYSEPGKGTVFKIYIPIAEHGVEHQAVTTLKTPEVVGAQTILLVEDDPLLRDGFSRMLTRKGYVVLAAAEGSEALKICETHKGDIHLLLTDMVMPEMSGIEIAKRALALRSNLRVLYMSGYMSDTLEDAGMVNLDQREFIQKPFNTSALVTKVQEILS